MANFIDKLDSIFELAHSNNLALSQGQYIFADIEEYWNTTKEHEFSYPLLWLHNDSLAHDSADSGNNPHTLGLTPQFTILDLAPLHDFAARKQVTSRTYDYTLAILSFLNRYRRATGNTSPVLDKGRQTNHTQIIRKGPDSASGWQVALPIQAQISLNLDAALWNQDTLPPDFFKP